MPGEINIKFRLLTDREIEEKIEEAFQRGLVKGLRRVRRRERRIAFLESRLTNLRSIRKAQAHIINAAKAILTPEQWNGVFYAPKVKKIRKSDRG